MLIVPVYYPLKGDDFDYTPIFHEDTMSILSVYNRTHKQWSSDIINMFNPVGNIFWFSMLMTFLIFSALYSIGTRILTNGRNIYETIWKTFRSFLNQIWLPSNRIFWATCSLLLSIFLAVTLNYINTSATTSLVTMERPMTIESYDDILNRKELGVTINKAWAELDAIKGLDTESKEYKLYLRSSDVSLRPFLPDYLDQKRVAIARLTITNFYGLAMMYLTDRTDARALVKVDEHGSKFTQVFAIRKNDDKSLVNLFNKILTNELELGFTGYEMKMFAQRAAIGFIGDEISPSLGRLVSSHVEEDEIQWSAIKISNTIHVFLLSFFGIILSMFVFIIEHIHSKFFQ